MSEELEVMRMVTQRLDKAGIPYMITGSMASNFYSMPRMTRDIDIVAEIKEQDVHKLIGIFRNDFYVDEESVQEAVRARGMFNILHNEWFVKVDFIIRKNSPYDRLEFERRRRAQKEDFVFWIISPEDLVLSKLLWAKDSFSEMQIRDVKNILRVSTDLDIPYIQQWVGTLGLAEVYKKAKL